MSVKNYFHAMSREHGIHPHASKEFLPVPPVLRKMHPIDCGPLLHTARDWFIQTRSDIFEDIALDRTCHGAVTQIVAKRPILGRKEKKGKKREEEWRKWFALLAASF